MTKLKKPEANGWSIFTEASILRMLVRGKTETRRLPRHQPSSRHASVEMGEDGNFRWDKHVIRPKHKAGDVIYAREPHWRDKRDRAVLIYAATPEWYCEQPIGSRGSQSKPAGSPQRSDYEALGPFPPPTREECRKSVEDSQFWKRKPAMLMPKWASRLYMRVTEVRCERLKLITEAACFAEGVRPADVQGFYTSPVHGLRAAYARVWDELHPDVSYDSDPLVLVYRWEFIEEASQRLRESMAEAA